MSTPSDYAANHWSASMATQLRDAARCPACRGPLNAGQCSRCGADLRGDAGAEIWRAADDAAEALMTFRALIARLATAGETSRPPVAPSPASAIATTDPQPVAVTRPSRTVAVGSRTSTTLQSVLAVAGAGLVGLAALVFSFFNPDVTDPIVRGGVLFTAAALFIVGAPVVGSHNLRVSAESVGMLALASLALGAAVVSPVLPVTLDPAESATLLALGGGSAAVALGVSTRIRCWMVTGALALTSVPLLASTALGGPVSALWGPLGAAATALLLLEAGARLSRHRSSRWMLERTCLVIAQVAAFLTLGVQSLQYVASTADPWVPLSLATLGASAVVARTARYALRRLWSAVAGASVPTALAIASLALDDAGSTAFTSVVLLVPTATFVGVLTLTALSSARGATSRRWVLGGATAVALLSLLPAFALAGIGSVIVVGFGWLGDSLVLRGSTGIAVVLSLVGAALTLEAVTRVASLRARRIVPRARALRPIALWVLGLAGVAALGLDGAGSEARATLGIALTAISAAVVSSRPVRTRITLPFRAPIITAGSVALVASVSLSWQSTAFAVALGPAALVALALLARSFRDGSRAVALAIGVSYGLVLVGTALQFTVLPPPAIVSVTATAGLALALLATFARWLPARYWLTILGVAVVPFLLAVGLIVVERSGWVAISTSTMVALAIALLVTTRPGLGIEIRALAGAIVVPSVAVIIIAVAAEFLATSGSPVALPLIAAVCAVTGVALDRVHRALRQRGHSEPHAAVIVAAIESTTVLTAAIAIVLAYAREAAGLPVALLVLVILTAAAAIAACVRGRRAYWWIAGMLATAALWTEWAILGLDLPEAFILPPTLGAAAVGIVATARGNPQVRLVAAPLGIATAAVLMVLALSPEPTPARAIALVGTSLALLTVGVLPVNPATGGGRVVAILRPSLLVIAMTASLAGAIQAARWGFGVDALPFAVPLPLAILSAALLSGALACAAGLALHTHAPTLLGRRWALLPGIAVASIATWTAIDTTRLAVIVVASVMVALLIALVAGVALSTSYIPPAVPLFALALGTAIVAWSPRELLRVEAFSLPLGAALLLAGLIALRRERVADDGVAPSLVAWPDGQKGSWALLAPGLIVLVLASVFATATDPQTWRAVLVMAIALVAIIVGVRWRLAAPFVLGMVILPIENVLAFSVQIGRGIEAMPWWITLLVVGVVLLVIAVGSERNDGTSGRSAVRLRDLR